MPSKYTPEMPALLLKLMSNGKSIVQCAAAMQIDKSTLYEWYKVHPEFKEAKDLGVEAFEAHWETIGQKGLTGMLNKFNPAAWMYYMKSRCRGDWKESTEQTITLADETKKLSNEQLDKKIKDILVAKKPIPTGG